MANLEIIQGDLTEQAVDAIVCPAHKHLSRGQGISAQVFAKAGGELVEACAAQSNCAVGEARITPGFGMPSRYLIHTVTPLWTGGDQWGGSELTQLRRCFESATALAMEYNLRSLAVPALGGGTNKFPQLMVAKVGLEVLNEQAGFFDRLVVVLRSNEAFSVWQNVQENLLESAFS